MFPRRTRGSTRAHPIMGHGIFTPGMGLVPTLAPALSPKLAPALVSAVLLGLALAGCAVGPDYVRPETEEPLPDAWSVQIQSELEKPQSDTRDWWSAFGDTMLTNLVARAEANNRNLKVAIARIEEARALRGIQKSQFWPQLNAAGSFQRQQLSSNGQGAILGGGDDLPPNNLWFAGFDASWELDIFGGIRRRVEASTAEMQASVEDYRDVMISLSAEVASSYIGVRTTQRRLAYARQNVDAQTESLDITRTRFETGLTSALDVAQAEANLSGTLSTIPQLETELEFSLNRLAVLLGENPGSLDAQLGPPRDIPTPSSEMERGVPADLLRRRPDIRGAERRLAAQTARIGVATSDLFPKFGLPGLLGWESGETDNWFDANSLVWNFMPSFRWNIFSAGKVKNNIEAEEARTEALLLNYEQTILLALEEVENSIAAYQQEQLRRDHLSDAVEAAGRSVELVRTQYLSGLTNFQNLLDSQRTLFNREDELAQSEGRVVQNLIALNKALGGGWSLDDPYPEFTRRKPGENPAAQAEPDANSDSSSRTGATGGASDTQGGER